MASTNYTGTAATAPAAAHGYRRAPRRLGTVYVSARTSQTTWLYRTSGGSRGSATSAADIPAGAVVLRVVTT